MFRECVHACTPHLLQSLQLSIRDGDGVFNARAISFDLLFPPTPAGLVVIEEFIIGCE